MIDRRLFLKSGAAAAVASGLAPRCSEAFVPAHLWDKYDSAAIAMRILGLVDHAHAALAQLLRDTIVGNGLAGHDHSN